MITAAHKGTDLEQHTIIQINKDIKLELQLHRTHEYINGGFLSLAAVKPRGISYYTEKKK